MRSAIALELIMVRFYPITLSLPKIMITLWDHSPLKSVSLSRCGLRAIKGDFRIVCSSTSIECVRVVGAMMIVKGRCGRSRRQFL